MKVAEHKDIMSKAKNAGRNKLRDALLDAEIVANDRIERLRESMKSKRMKQETPTPVSPPKVPPPSLPPPPATTDAPAIMMQMQLQMMARMMQQQMMTTMQPASQTAQHNFFGMQPNFGTFGGAFRRM